MKIKIGTATSSFDLGLDDLEPGELYASSDHETEYYDGANVYLADDEGGYTRLSDGTRYNDDEDKFRRVSAHLVVEG